MPESAVISATRSGSAAAASRAEISASRSARSRASFSASNSCARSIACAHWLPSATTNARTAGDSGRGPSNRNVSAPSTRPAAISGTVALAVSAGSGSPA